MPGGGISRVAKAPVDAKTNSNPTTKETFKLGDFAVDEYKPVRVIVIGAGFSGILAGIRQVQPSPNPAAVAESTIPQVPSEDRQCRASHL